MNGRWWRKSCLLRIVCTESWMYITEFNKFAEISDRKIWIIDNHQSVYHFNIDCQCHQLNRIWGEIKDPSMLELVGSWQRSPPSVTLIDWKKLLFLNIVSLKYFKVVLFTGQWINILFLKYFKVGLFTGQWMINFVLPVPSRVSHYI